MTLTPGTRVGPYEIVSAIGAGGMGEVYRATDSNLKRSVAIKVLPASVAGDADRLARFQREAEVLAALNHPNIAAIYGLEKTPDLTALVMELVEGEDLSEIIARPAGRSAAPSERTGVGPHSQLEGRGLPLAEALPIAKQIADALEAAHEQGIVHRDLKPANIKVRADGTVKVLDFGLAKALDPAATSSGAAMNSPTMTARATQMGMILGTAAYMAPEQAKGKSVDRRADIWAFGVVLYEMLTGRRLFDAEDISETLAAVLTRDVSLTSMPSDIPSRLRTLLRDCLIRDPKQRLRDIGDARLVLDKIIAGAPDDAVGVATATAAIAPSSSRALPWALAAAAAVMATALAIPALRHLREAPAAERVANLSMDLAPADRLGPTGTFARPSRTAFAIAPDGATIVFAGESTAPAGTPTTKLYRRPLAEATAVVIPGTDGAQYPFFSPDGQWVGFAAGNKLKKVALSGGPPIELCDIDSGSFGGGSWGSAGVIAFSSPGLRTVSEAGGTPEEPVPNTSGVAPAMLPDGQTVLFTDVPSSLKWEGSHIDVLNLKTKERKTLLTNAADARYSPTGHLVFMRNATLLAVPFDAARVEITGAAVPLLAGVMQSTNATNRGAETGMGQFALSASGTLIYAVGDRNPTRHSTMVRVDRKGVETKLAEVKGSLIGLRLSSSDSRVIAFQSGDGSRASDLWMYEVPSGTPTRLTATGEASYPLFSADGKSVTFLAGGTSPGVYSLPLGSSNAPQIMIDGKDQPRLADASWSADGKWLAYLQSVKGVEQIFVRAAQDSTLNGEPRQFSPSAFDQTHADFSPDGHWIAYVSNESGANEVFVQPFPGPGEKRRISTGGGSSPAWARNGRELYYLARHPGATSSSMVAVDVSTAGGFTAGAPRLLFEGPYFSSNPLRSYDVTANGQFIMSRLQSTPDEPVTRLNVILGWAETLKARVPVKK